MSPTESWLQASSRALASTGVLGMIRRRSLQILLASSLDDETGPRARDLTRESGNARAVLLDAWAASEFARRTLDSEISTR